MAGTVAARGQASPTHCACLSRCSEPVHSAHQFAKDPDPLERSLFPTCTMGRISPAPQVGMVLGVASTEVKSSHGEGWR